MEMEGIIEKKECKNTRKSKKKFDIHLTLDTNYFKLILLFKNIAQSNGNGLNYR